MDAVMDEEREPKVRIREVPIDHPLVVAEIDRVLSSSWKPGRTVMIHRQDRYGRSHLHLHRDRAGNYFVRVGMRGSGKQILDRCEITYLDDEPTLFVFRFKKSDAQLEWERKERVALGIED